MQYSVPPSRITHARSRSTTRATFRLRSGFTLPQLEAKYFRLYINFNMNTTETCDVCGLKVADSARRESGLTLCASCAEEATVVPGCCGPVMTVAVERTNFVTLPSAFQHSDLKP